MQIYNYHKITSEYLDERAARPNHREPGEFRLPANSTFVKPPLAGQYKKQVWNGSDWDVVDDYRFVPYYLLPDRTKHYVAGLGEDIPSGAVLELPPLTVAEQRAKEIRRIRYVIDQNTPAVIARYHHAANNTDYNLTKAVQQQFLDIKSQAEISTDPASLFPVEIMLGFDEATGLETTVTVNTITAFKTAYLAILDHVLTTQAEARAMKAGLDALTNQEIIDWIDTRI